MICFLINVFFPPHYKQIFPLWHYTNGLITLSWLPADRDTIGHLRFSPLLTAFKLFEKKIYDSAIPPANYKKREKSLSKYNLLREEYTNCGTNTCLNGRPMGAFGSPHVLKSFHSDLRCCPVCTFFVCTTVAFEKWISV